MQHQTSATNENKTLIPFASGIAHLELTLGNVWILEAIFGSGKYTQVSLVPSFDGDLHVLAVSDTKNLERWTKETDGDWIQKDGIETG